MSGPRSVTSKEQTLGVIEAARIIESNLALRVENERLRAALDGIRVYGSDTLSGRVDGPDDREWQRESVREMTKRAREALSANPSAVETSAPHRDTERLKWLANTVLCCDYGDNSHPSKLPGWRVMEFVAPVIYGKTLQEAIDTGMDDEFHRRRQRQAKPTIADLEKILQSEDTIPVTILPDGTIATPSSAQETEREPEPEDPQSYIGSTVGGPLPESLRDPVKNLERGRELLAQWPCWCPYCKQPHGVNQTPVTDAALAENGQGDEHG